MPSENYLLSVFWGGNFVKVPGEPSVVDCWELSVVCAAQPGIDGLKPGDALELCLKGEAEGAGLKCALLSYKPDFWKREIGRTFTVEREWPLPGEAFPELKPLLSISVPELKSPALRPGFSYTNGVREYIDFVQEHEIPYKNRKYRTY